MRMAFRLFVLMLLAAFVPFGLISAPENSGSIAGLVKTSSRLPLAGVLVKAKNDDRRLSVTVVTQTNGQYRIPNLPAGKYTVQAWGAGLQSETASVEVDGVHSATQNLTANQNQDPRKTLSITDYSAVLPPAEQRQVIVSLCTDCHQNGLQEIVYSRKDRDGWSKTIQKMRHNPYAYFRSLVISEEQKEAVAAYLAQNFGPDVPPLDETKLPKFVIQGEATKAVVTEYDLPDGAEAHDVAVDSHGIGWTSEGGLGAIGRFDPTMYTYEHLALPGADKSGSADAIVDSQDRIWVSDSRNSRLVRYDPKTEAFASFPVPKPEDRGPEFNTIRIHPDGTIWATQISINAVLHLDPATNQSKWFPFPSPTGESGNAYGMAIDPSGIVWFVEPLSEKYAKIDPETGKATEYSIPGSGQGITRLRRMQSDAHGNIWIGEFGGKGKLLEVDSHTGKLTEYDPPTSYAGPYSVDIDRVHDIVWVNEMMADQIARFDPRTKTFTEFRIPTGGSSIRRIEVDPSRPTRVWYSGLYRDTVGYIDVAP